MNGNRTDAYLRQGGDTPAVVHGDHDMSCGNPNQTKRDLDVADGDTSKFFYQCLPGGNPAAGHVMSAFDTTGYAIMSFSPKQTFTDVNRICFDVNATDEGGGKWTDLTVVSADLYRQHAPRLDYVVEDFDQGDFNLKGLPAWGIKDFRGTQHQIVNGNVTFSDGEAHVTDDRAPRYTHCVENRAGGGATLTVERPEGGISTFVLPEAIPSGEVKVIFQDVMYNPPKRAGYDASHVTWHWDNIEIS
jgi:hypothetical protein